MKIILELSKILMHEFWYDCVKPKYGKMWVSLWTYTHDIYKDIVDIETRFDASNYELERPLPKGKNKKVILLMKEKNYVEESWQNLWNYKQELVVTS